MPSSCIFIVISMSLVVIQQGVHMSSQSMKVVCAEKPGAAKLLKFQDQPIPKPQPGQVLIRVESASVNFSDVKRRRGDVYPFETQFPFVPGGEVAGTVEALGQGVDGLAIGTNVFALVGGDGQSGYAQYALAYAPQVFPIPPGLDVDRASVLTIAGATAMMILKQVGGLRNGQSVAISAAAGGVGSYAVQIAKKLGAGNVVALASSAEKLAVAKKLGADHAINQNDRDWPEQLRALTGGKGVDLFLESGGGESLKQSLRARAAFGRVVVYGAASGQDAALDAVSLKQWLYAPALNQSIVAFNIGAWFLQKPEIAGPAMGELIGMVASGAIQTPALHLMPLSKASDAHDLLESRHSTGKIVLKPWMN
jgi:NADPH:quinone reductase